MDDWRKNKKREVKLDGIGGVNILVKAEVHRSGKLSTHLGAQICPSTYRVPLSHNLTRKAGISFPCYAFENQADTEGFAAMAERAGYQVAGLPNYVVWHVDTEEKEGNIKGNKAQIEAKEAKERERAQAQRKKGSG